MSTAATAHLNASNPLDQHLTTRSIANLCVTGIGNIIELCAAKLYPDPKINLGFTMCITRQYREIPERTLIEDCALEHAIDIQAINDCAAKEDGAYGVGMLRDSVRRTADVRDQPLLRSGYINMQVR